jgi:hypothetical protein
MNNQTIVLESQLMDVTKAGSSAIKLNSYGDSKQKISIAVASDEELNNILPENYLDYFSKMRVKTIGELFTLVDKVFNDHKMDSTTIYLYFYTHLTWYKITMQDFINIAEADVLNYYKEFLASYFNAKVLIKQ